VKTIGSIKSLLTRILPVRSMAARVLRGRAMIVTFHRVNEVNAGDGLTLSPDEFEDHCRFLSDHFDVVPLAEIVQRLESGGSLDGHVAITFDDGYRDNCEVAAPILARHGLPATFFVTTGFIGTDVLAPWDSDLTIAPGWMTWDQVRGLHEQGFTIGGHTIDHVDLGDVSGDTAMRQLTTSRAVLREQLGEEVELFAYPFGRRDNMTEENRLLVREAGFSCCASCFGGFVEAGMSPLALPRVGISSWYASPELFALDMALGRL
jgi:peptidoglycan/xylan/chitin deacetylase (PgdA/CDA1 family)